MYSVGLLDLTVLVTISNRYSLYALCLLSIEIAHIGSSTNHKLHTSHNPLGNKPFTSLDSILQYLTPECMPL